MKIRIIVVSLHEIVVDIHRLFIVAIVERAICDTHVSLQIVPLRVLSVAFQKGQGSDPITLLHERGGLRNFQCICLCGRNLLELWDLLSFNG